MARRGGWYVALATLLALSASGCGDASPDSPPSGIDGLEIPTPSPDPQDFVRRVDNPWLPLVPGSTRRYQLLGSTGVLVIEVEDTTHEVAGIDTTPVSRTEPDGEQTVDYFAQDRRGNVWWLGREGEWLAGKDGAQAGLAMPAVPRVGDGWRAAYDGAGVDVRLTVVTRDQLVSTPAGRFTHVVGLDLTNPLEPGTGRRDYYAKGVGLVEEVATDGPFYRADLVTAPG